MPVELNRLNALYQHDTYRYIHVYDPNSDVTIPMNPVYLKLVEGYGDSDAVWP